MINNNNQQRVTGFNCPSCNGLIPISALDLITKPVIICPSCSLSLILDRQQSRRALDLLSNIERSKTNLEQASSVSL